MASRLFRLVVRSSAATLAVAGAASVAAAQKSPPVHGGITAFTDVSVVPMDTDRVLEHQTVLVRAGRITAIGPNGRVHIPKEAQRIDGHGKFLMPGLADMHAHFASGVHIATVPGTPVDVPTADSAGTMTRLFMWLANGVTTVRNLDYYDENWAKFALRLRARSDSSIAWLPHIYTAGEWGPIPYIAGPQLPPPGHLDSIAAYVAAYKAAGYDNIKVHNELPEVLDSVLVAAQRVGIPVAGHVPPPSRVEHVLSIGGYKSIEHPFTDYLWNNRQTVGGMDTAGFAVLAGLLHKSGVWHCPTQQHYDRLHFVTVSLLKIEQDSGIKMLLGTDEVPWLGVITRELQAMVGGGLTPYQALLTGTRNVAEYWGMLKERGTVAVGKQADLILLTGNPLQDVRYTAQPLGVMIGGRWLSRAEIAKQIATLRLPTFDHNGLADTLMAEAPVKSYWHNVADEFNEGTVWIYRSVPMTEPLTTTLEQLRIKQHVELVALTDSLGASDQYKEGTQRIVTRLATHMGEFRNALTPTLQPAFDQAAKGWADRLRAGGYTVNIPGVTS